MESSIGLGRLGILAMVRFDSGVSTGFDVLNLQIGLCTLGTAQGQLWAGMEIKRFRGGAIKGSLLSHGGIIIVAVVINHGAV